MARRKGCAAIGVSVGFLLVLTACGSEEDVAAGASSAERQTIRAARTEGQTTMAASCQPVPEPRPFPADDVRALIEGTYSTTLAYRPERRSPGSSFDDAVGLPMTVRVELEGEPRIDPEVFERCNFRIEQDVEVTLSLDEPALDVVVETTASAFSSTFAVILLELGSDVSTALGLPPRGATFSLVFDETGMKGSFDPNDDCGSAVFPASVRCIDWSRIEVDLDRERQGLRPQLLSALEGLSDVPLEWNDGTPTTLAVSLSEAPEWACSGDWVATFCPERLEIPVTLRATTADGRLDAELRAELSFEVATEASAAEASCGFARTAGEIEGLSVIASYFGADAGGPSPDVFPPLEPGTGFSLHVWRAPESPDRAAAEFRMLALEQRDLTLTPPLDATTDAATARCVAFGTFAEAERP